LGIRHRGLRALALMIAFSATVAAIAGPTPADAALSAPDAVDDLFTIKTGSRLTVDAPGVLANDVVNGGALALVTDPTSGALTFLSDGSFTYTPNTGFVGTDSFVYELSTTSTAASLLADVWSGSISSRREGDATPIAVLGSEIFFPALDDEVGRELFKTDGTTTGTQVVADIYPGAQSGIGPREEQLVPFANLLWFRASTDGTAAGSRLWATDGTSAGTTPISTVVDPQELAVNGAALYLSAEQDGLRYLHVVSSTGEVTVHTEAALPGSPTPVPVVATGEVVPYADGVAFVGSNAQVGEEVWYATESGVSLLVDAAPGEVAPGVPYSSAPFRLAVANTDLYLGASQDFENSWQYYRFAPSTPTVVQVLDAVPTEVEPGKLGLLYASSDGIGLLDSTGTSVDLTPPEITGSAMGIWLGDRILFPATDTDHGTELWASEGTAGDASLLADIVPGTGSSSPRDLTVVGNDVYLTASNGSFRTPWISDGFAETRQIAEVDPYGPTDEAVFGGLPGTVVFWADDFGSAGYEPWVHTQQVLADQATVTIDVTDTLSSLALPVTETIRVDDIVAVLLELGIPVTEAITVDDLVTVLTGLGVTVEEAVTVVDAVTVLLERDLPATELLRVTDVIEILIGLGVDTGELISITDDVEIAPEASFPDADGDGIEDLIDGYIADSGPLSGQFAKEDWWHSDRFTDVHRGGATSGTVAARATGLQLRVHEESGTVKTTTGEVPAGVRLTASGNTTAKAEVDLCEDPTATLSLTDGDVVTVTCASVHVSVVSGPVEFGFGNGTDVVARTGAIVHVANDPVAGISVTSDPESSGQVVVTLEGETTVLEPSQTTLANATPVATDDLYETVQAGWLFVPAPGLLANDADPDLDALTAALTEAPSRGIAYVAADGALWYWPHASFRGTDELIYEACDAGGACDTATTTITVRRRGLGLERRPGPL